jgi:PAS domain S-box-containing protein
MELKSILTHEPRSLELFERVLKETKYAYYESDSTGLTIFSSDTEVALLGYSSKEEIVGKKYRSELWAYPEKRDKFLARLKERGTLHRYPCQLKRKDGSTVWIETTSFLTSGSGGEQVVAGLYCDITPQKTVESHRERLISGPTRLEEFYHLLLGSTAELFESNLASLWYVNPRFRSLSLRTYLGYEQQEMKNLWIDFDSSLCGQFVLSGKNYSIVDDIQGSPSLEKSFAADKGVTRILLLAIPSLQSSSPLPAAVFSLYTSISWEKVETYLTSPWLFEVSIMLQRALLLENKGIFDAFDAIFPPHDAKPVSMRQIYLKSILDAIKNQFAIQSAGFYQPEDIDGSTKWKLEAGDDVQGYSLDRERFVASQQQCATEGYPLIRIEQPPASQFEAERAKLSKICSSALIPIRSHHSDKVHGVLCCCAHFTANTMKHPDVFSEEDLDRLSTVAQIVATNLEKIDSAELRWKSMRKAAHAFPSPIKDIFGAVEFMEKQLIGSVPDESNRILFGKLLGRVNQKARAVQRLSDHILGKKPLQKDIQRIDIRDIALDCIHQEFPRLRGRRIPTGNVFYTGASGLPIYASEEDIKEVFENLLVNAIKYSVRPGTDARIEIVPFEGKQGEVRLAFRDNGIGIDPKEVEYLFDWGYRSERAEEYDREGVGLGLAIIKDIVEEYEGTIHVTSLGRTVGEQPTEITITFPRSIRMKPAESQTHN